MTKKWLVELPVVGKLTFEVVAPDGESAIETAFSMDQGEGNLEWGTVSKVTDGNYFTGPLNEAYAEEIE